MHAVRDSDSSKQPECAFHGHSAKRVAYRMRTWPTKYLARYDTQWMDECAADQ
jgi:hypothetical protein